MRIPANRIAELVEARGWRLAHLAVECDVAESTVNRWCSGKSAIPDGAKIRLAEIFDVTVAYLMRWDEKAAA